MDQTCVPVHVRGYFSLGELTQEEESLINDLENSIRAGTKYDHNISVRLIYLIYERKGKEYKRLIRFTGHYIKNSALKHYVDVQEMSQRLVEKVVFTQDNREWHYFTEPFNVFANKAITSMLDALKKKKKPEIIDEIVSLEDGGTLISNITENVADPYNMTVEDDYIADETILKCKEYTKATDPVAYNILLRVDESYEEIAEELGITVRDVANGKKRLKRIWREFFPLYGTLKLNKRKEKRERNNSSKSDDPQPDALDSIE